VATEGATRAAIDPDLDATLAARYAAVHERVATACERAGRDPAEVTIVGISKTHPFATIAAAARAGIADLGENRAQEFVPKAEEAAAAALDLRWHFVGHLQRNKARQVLPHLYALHSLDSAALVDEIDRRWSSGETPASRSQVRCYVEVNVAGETQKAGVVPSAVSPLLDRASASPALEVAGLMTVAPRVDDPEDVRPVFRELRELARAHGLTGLSMGMTEDYAVAIEEGATVIRVGRAIFGERLA
jgi:hypothetical protein